MPVEAMIVIDPGPWTTVQDLGRYGYQRYGVPVSGAMDALALRVGNLLVGNDFSYAPAHGIEMTFSFGNVFYHNRLVENAICGIWAATPRIR